MLYNVLIRHEAPPSTIYYDINVIYLCIKPNLRPIHKVRYCWVLRL